MYFRYGFMAFFDRQLLVIFLISGGLSFTMRLHNKIILNSAFIIIVSAALTIFWWRGWLYSGFWGPPLLLNSFLSIDGEASYNAMMLQTFVISSAVCTLLYFIVLKG